MNLNIVFPVGKKPNIVEHESPQADKDCYIYWEGEYLKLQPSWLPTEDIKHKEVYAINGMQKRIDNLQSQLKDANEVIAFYGLYENWVSCIDGQYNIGKIWVYNDYDNRFIDSSITTENGIKAREYQERWK